jgi:hypothetical protein
MRAPTDLTREATSHSCKRIPTGANGLLVPYSITGRCRLGWRVSQMTAGTVHATNRSTGNRMLVFII